MSAEVSMARDELRQAKRRARCDSALDGAGSEVGARWAALVVVAFFTVIGFGFLADGNIAQGAIATFGAVVLGWCAAWHWWRAGVRSGVAHAQATEAAS